MTPRPGYHYDLESKVREAIQRGTPSESLSKYEETKLITAVFIDGLLDLAEELFKAGATMTADDFSHVIWWGGDAEYLLKRGVPHDADCLRTAIRHENWGIVFTLLDYGADIQTPLLTSFPEIKSSLLHVAAWKHNAGAVERLLKRGAEVDNRDDEGMTPLMKSCEIKANDCEFPCNATYWLLKHGADPNACNAEGKTPLLLCTGEKLPVVKDRTEMARMLLRYGANPNVASSRGITPLMCAAQDNDIVLARALLHAGAKLDMKMADGRTAFDVAIKHGSEDVWDLLRQ